MKRSTTTLLSLPLFALTLWSCTKDSSSPVSPNLPATNYNYGAAGGKDKIAPIGWVNSTSINTAIGSVKPSVNTTTESNGGATLGRVIFFDNLTSVNLANNCSRCHATPPRMPNHITDGYAVLQSSGTNSGNVKNVMPRYNDNSNTDSRTAILTSAHSGLVSAEAVMQRMRARTYYAQLFANAFGTSDITPERINEALSLYIAAASHSTAEELSRDVRFSDPFSK